MCQARLPLLSCGFQATMMSERSCMQKSCPCGCYLPVQPCMALGDDDTVHLCSKSHFIPAHSHTFNLHAEVDFCVTLGGDGTVLHLASLFSEDAPLPPLVSFAMGTLGFLTPFDAADYAACLTQVLEAAEKPVFCTLRTRKQCQLTGCDPLRYTIAL